MKKIAIACNGDVLSQHFGHCPEFRIFQVDGENYEMLESFITEGHGCHDLPSILKDMGVTAVIVGGMGANPKNRFGEMGIEVFLVNVNAVDSIVRDFAAGNLVSSLGTCSEHEGHHSDGSCGHHGHQHGNGSCGHKH